VPPPVPDDHALAIAAFRHRCLVAALEAEEEAILPILTAEARQARTDPAGRARMVSVRTLARWLAAYRRGGLLALCPQRRTDHGALRAIPPEVFARAQALRRQKPARPTKTIIDILVRQQHVAPHAIARSTLDRHLARQGLSRHMLRSLGQQTFRRIATTTPFELVVADFHHGPYVRTPDGTLRRALLGAHIDHFSRYLPEGRYFLHEDYAALRFGFRRLLTAFGLPVTYYVDRGSAFQATRFHAACDTLGIRLVHSAPYQSECPRWTPENRPVMDGSKPASGAGRPKRCESSTASAGHSARGLGRAVRSRVASVALEARAPAARAAGEHMRVMQEAIEKGRDRRGVAEELPPVLDGTVGRDQRRGAFVAAHHNLEEILGRRLGELAHAQVVDDEQRDAGQMGEVRFARAVELGLGEFLEEDVRLAVADAMALLDDGDADRLGKVALAGAGAAEEEAVLPLGDEAAGGELEDERTVHLLVEVEVEGVERLVGIAEAGLLEPAVEQPVLAREQLVLDEGRQKVKGH
jgi:transposase InsO family protein